MFKYVNNLKTSMNALAKYIEKEIEKGFSEDLIKDKLKQAGYNEEEVNNAFREYYRKEQYHRIISNVVDKDSEKRWIIIVLSIVAVILLTIFIVLAVQHFSWNEIIPIKKTVLVDPETEDDCSVFTHRDKERCLLKVAAYQDSTVVCVNMTSKVMKYECRTAVWEKNYCNFLILTNQSTTNC